MILQQVMLLSLFELFDLDGASQVATPILDKTVHLGTVRIASCRAWWPEPKAD